MKKGSIGVRIIKWILLVAAIIVAAFLALLLLLTATEFRPADRESLAVEGSAKHAALKPGQALSVMTWNIGYGALDQTADFFMDGGKSVKTAGSTEVNLNMIGIINGLEEVDPDIAFLQEVDVKSARSSKINEAAMLIDPANRKLTQVAQSSFATNYRSLFIPYPLPPIGKVDAGILTLSDYQITSSERVQLPCPFSWPLRLGNLKRCLMVDRIPVEGTGHELVIINLHLEAYDDGAGKAAQTKMLKELMEAELAQGNYVIAGGDFNQSFPQVDLSAYPAQEGKWQAGILDADQFSEGWQFLMDPSVPSCRSLDQPYAGADQESFQYYMIDGFIVSENISIESCRTLDYGFVNSDHNPVLLQVKLQKS